MPDFRALANPQIYIIAITLAVRLKRNFIVEATDKLDPYERYYPNQS